MVVAYLRVSTGKQHLENQQSEINRYATVKGISIDRWVTEVVSGKAQEKDRELGKLMKSLQKGDTLIVTEISRLSRTLHDIMSIMGRCLKRNITIYSTKDGYAFDDSINSKVLSFAFGLVAEIEHKLISQRTKEALAARRAEGVILGRKKGSITKLQILIDNKSKILEMLKSGDTIAHICRQQNVSRDTFNVFRHKYVIIDNAILKNRRSTQLIGHKVKAASCIEI